MARGLCFKPRPPSAVPDGPMQPGEKYKLNVESREFEPTWDSALPGQGELRPLAGSAPVRPSTGTASTTTGIGTGIRNGDHGNQGPHQFDIARWGCARTASAAHPVGGRDYGEPRRRRRRTGHDVYEYPTARSRFRTRGGYTNEEGTQRSQPFYGTKGGLDDGDGRKWQRIWRKDEKGPARHAPPESSGSDPGASPASSGQHYRTHRRRAGGDRFEAHCGVLEATLVGPAPLREHLLPRGSGPTFDGQTETFVGGQGSGQAPPREYRKPFEVPARLVAGL